MTVFAKIVSFAMKHAGLVLALVLFTISASARGQEGASLRGESSQTRKRLAEAEQKLIAGNHADAIDDLQRVIDEVGDDLITVDGKQYRTARSITQGLLARLPARALKNYQDRVDDPARKLLAKAKQTSDPAPLWQLVDRYLISRPANEGLLLLGDWLFERGEFRAAERLWRRLLPDAGGDIIYPGTQHDPAAVRARLVLALIFQHDMDRARTALASFKTRHPGASGLLAGKKAPFAETLQGLLDSPPASPLRAILGINWPTYGGGPDRSGRIAARLTGEWPFRPSWVRILPQEKRHPDSPVGPPSRPPYCHPVIVNGQVFVIDGTRLISFDLITGIPTGTLELADSPDFPKAPDAVPTLSAFDDRIYARIGPAAIKPSDGAKGDRSAIVCIQARPGARGTLTLRELWRIAPPRDEDMSVATWEGAPVVADRRMWVAYSRFEAGRIVHGIACYDPCDSLTAPERSAWAVDICDGPFIGNPGRVRHELLTLAGRHIVFCTNTGAVVALNATTGQRSWAYRYSRASHSDATHSPHATPAVFSAGRLFVAPADADHVYALDPDTGESLWQLGNTEGAAILGVSAGRLVVTTEGPVKCIRGLDVDTGSYAKSRGWIQGDAGGLLSYGRGFVTDDMVVWPTRSGLQFLRSEDGRPLRDEVLRGPLMGEQSGYFGNVVYGDGVIIVVTPTQIWGYVSEARRFGPAESRTEFDPVQGRFHRLVERTETALANGDLPTARAGLLSAARGQLPKAYRAWAAARLLMLTPRVAEESALPAEVRSALAPELRDEWLFSPNGMPITLAGLIDHHVGRGPLPPPSRPSPWPRHCPQITADAPSLPGDADIRRTIRLPPGTAPLRWIMGAPSASRNLYFTTGTKLLAIPLGPGGQTRFSAQGLLTRVADVGDGFVAVGPLAVVLYGSQREPIWEFHVPLTIPLPQRPGLANLVTGPGPAPPELSSFVINGAWLFARLGERHLIAFDLGRRQVAWVLAATGEPKYQPTALPNATRFEPVIGVTTRALLVQLSNGNRWLISVERDKVLPVDELASQTSRVAWRSAPVEAQPNIVAVADGPDVVRLLDLARGVVRWTNEIDGEASLAGDPPQVRVDYGALLMVVRRNHGFEMDRLDLADGKSLWPSGAVFLDSNDVEFAGADSDAECVVVPTGDRLLCICLRDGTRAWEARLPETHGAGGWRVRVGQKCVIAYPELALPREPVSDVLGRLLRSFRNEPTLPRLPGLALGAYDAWITRSVPVLLFDLETGERLVRFDIPATGPAVTVRFERDAAVVATGDRVVWVR